MGSFYPARNRTTFGTGRRSTRSPSESARGSAAASLAASTLDTMVGSLAEHMGRPASPQLIRWATRLAKLTSALYALQLLRMLFEIYGQSLWTPASYILCKGGALIIEYSPNWVMTTCFTNQVVSGVGDPNWRHAIGWVDPVVQAGVTVWDEGYAVDRGAWRGPYLLNPAITKPEIIWPINVVGPEIIVDDPFTVIPGEDVTPWPDITIPKVNTIPIVRPIVVDYPKPVKNEVKFLSRIPGVLAAFMALEAVSEVKDFVEAIWKTLPKYIRRASYSGWGGKLDAIINNLDKIPANEAVGNLFANTLEDKFLGKYFQMTGQAGAILNKYDFVSAQVFYQSLRAGSGPAIQAAAELMGQIAPQYTGD